MCVRNLEIRKKSTKPLLRPKQYADTLRLLVRSCHKLTTRARSLFSFLMFTYGFLVVGKSNFGSSQTQNLVSKLNKFESSILMNKVLIQDQKPPKSTKCLIDINTVSK